MKVRELIALLQTFNPELPVAYKCCSEQVLLDADDIDIRKGCLPRPDGWIQDARPDMAQMEYVLFPGN